MKRFFSGLVVAIAMMIPVLGCHGEPKELKIAIIAPLSGYFVGWGNLVRDGAQLAIDEWNAKGGILSMKIVLVKEDSKGNPTDAANVAKEAITKEGIRYFVGDVFSSLSIPISDVANASKAILITPTSTNTAVTVDQSGATKAYVFRACFSDPFQGSAGASFAAKNLKAQKAYVMFDPYDVYVNGLAQAFVDAFTKLGGTIVGKAIYSNNDSDFSKTLAAISSSMPDVVYLPASSFPLINLVTKQAKDKGITATFIGGDFWDSLGLDLKAIDGSYFTSHYWPADPRPEVQAFQMAYNQKYGASGTPDIVAGLSYDATNMML
ncbi:MAG: ABC transporter substrate-binding protein [Spirochaetia bacterium]|jgi:branched-chain amino acid transport system substrate-binding protein